MPWESWALRDKEELTRPRSGGKITLQEGIAYFKKSPVVKINMKLQVPEKGEKWQELRLQRE